MKRGQTQPKIDKIITSQKLKIFCQQKELFITKIVVAEVQSYGSYTLVANMVLLSINYRLYSDPARNCVDRTNIPSGLSYKSCTTRWYPGEFSHPIIERRREGVRS